MKPSRRFAIAGMCIIALVALGGYAYSIFGPLGPPSPSESLTYGGATWTVFRPEVFDVVVDGSALHLTLNRVARWAGNGQGGLVFQPITGDFRATATVLARERSDSSQAVSSWVSLGGLTARDPAGADVGGAENYVHIVVGNTPRGIGVETKTTVDGATTYEAVPGPSADADLRICRVAGTFYLYNRPVGTRAWTLAATYERGDLPATLQVGANVYAVLPPDLRVTVEHLVLEPVADREACQEP